MNSCKIFSTEYSRHYRKKKISPAKIILQRDLFAERIEKGEIDPRTASIPTQLDEAAEQLLYKHILDNLQSVCHVSYKNPWISHDEKQDKNADAETKEKDLQNELIAYIQGLYFNPHEEKILAPPATVKRMLAYIRPKLLHGNLSTYQDTFGRTGATVMLQEREKKSAIISKNVEMLENNKSALNVDKPDCANLSFEN